MIQGDFHGVVGSKTEGFSGGQFCLGVKTLHDATGELAFGAEPIEQERAVSAQHPGGSQWWQFSNVAFTLWSSSLS